MALFTPTANPAAIAAVNDVLKEVWVTDTLESQLYEDTVFLDWFDEVTEYTNSDGDGAHVPLRVGRTGGIGSRQVGELLPPPDHQRVAKAIYNYANHYLQVAVNGPVVARMETDRQACIREIDFEISNGLDDVKKDHQRQLYGDGTGRITFAALPGGGSSTTVLLSAANFEAIDKGWLYEGMAVDIGTLANPVLDTGGNRIASITDSSSAPAIVLENATATTAASMIFRAGNRTAANGSSEMNGIRNIVSDTITLGGIDPTAAGKGWWKSVVDGNSGTPRALSISLMLATTRKLRQRGDKPDFGLTDLVQEEYYYKLLQGNVRYIGDKTIDGSGNTEGMQFRDLTLIADPEHPAGMIHFGRKKALQMFSAGPIAWQNQTTGGDVLAWSQNYDQFIARAAKYCSPGTNRRRSLGRLTDLTAT